MVAEVLSAAGVGVVVHEAMPSVGRKFLMAGRGGLNLTHTEPLPAFTGRYGDSAGWVAPWLDRFGPEDLRAFADGLGQETFAGSSGRVFPRAMKASPMLRAWLARLEARGVRIVTRSRFAGWDAAGAPLFTGADGGFRPQACEGLVLAFGGASWPRLGSDGQWAPLLAARGVATAPFGPANAGVLVDWSAHVRERHAGAVLKAVTLSAGGAQRQGDLILTRTGLEGGPVYALGPVWRAPGFDGRATLNLRPSLNPEAIAARLTAGRAGRSLPTLLKAQLKLTPAEIALLHEAGRPLPAEPRALAGRIQALPLVISGQAGLERAISSTGGIRQEAVSPDLMLNALPGTFVCGEMLDWDAPTGGYLLQATFASAVVAAEGMMKWLAQQQHRT
jgi:hypothetical protein